MEQIENWSFEDDKGNHLLICYPKQMNRLSSNSQAMLCTYSLFFQYVCRSLCPSICKSLMTYSVLFTLCKLV